MSANIGIKLMAVAVILAMANLLSGYYGLRSPGVFAHSLECAHDILVRDFVLSLAISGADYDVVDRWERLVSGRQDFTFLVMTSSAFISSLIVY